MMPPGLHSGGYPTLQRKCMALLLGSGENTVRPERRHRLAESKDKDCDRQPNQSDKSPEHERGKVRRNDKGVDPDERRAGGASVVVRDGESPLHGEGKQFNLLELRIIRRREVKTFDNR